MGPPDYIYYTILYSTILCIFFLFAAALHVHSCRHYVGFSWTSARPTASWKWLRGPSRTTWTCRPSARDALLPWKGLSSRSAIGCCCLTSVRARAKISLNNVSRWELFIIPTVVSTLNYYYSAVESGYSVQTWQVQHQAFWGANMSSASFYKIGVS